jgi:preprotein translocase subunit SecB
MENAPIASFNFEGFKIIKSYFEINDSDNNQTFSINFNPKGVINKESLKFEMELGVIINENDNKFRAEIIVIGHFKFGADLGEDMLDNFFYKNAPAILFPYIRAYITTLTSLSGINPVILPTLNLSMLGPELKKNTITV